ncbi:malto-oligosyltrehalose synthase [Flavisolibacter nicotianae]|uniref:malto-oligosyltrehalose synthase n=1 Tax=Flavisolibacter nicotianae TaxID=2364882 RepID=UPI000EABA366|nr:malto-oligosyltrehalose synthase [Flavisolibacter nicotianae]
MFNPISTYRVQLHKDFPLSDLEKIIPYLQQMGIGTLYASPIFTAVPGSVHGYDSVDPLHVNPEIGTGEQLRNVAQQLADSNIHWLQDIVPNHMAFDHRNGWLADVLEKGQQSAYASFFDIAWTSPLFNGKLMVPFLGKSLEDAVQDGELKIVVEEGRLFLAYFDSRWPLKTGSYVTLLRPAAGNDALETLLQELDILHKTEDSLQLQKGWEEFLLQLRSLMKNERVSQAILQAIDQYNQDPQALLALAKEQHYQLCHWQETDHRINYRRFFTVNGLICLNIQDENVLHTHHAFLQTLVSEGLIRGLRIDHIDGLYNPAEYLHRLRARSGDEIYIVVEKILERGEQLPGDWPVQGTTGYDFLSQVNNLFTHQKAEESFTEFYQDLTGNYSSIEQQLHNKKALILEQHMGGELENLYRLLLQLNIVDKRTLARIPSEDLKTVIGEFLVQCPVYRFYGSQFPLSGEEEDALRQIFNRLLRTEESQEAVRILEAVFLQRPHEGNAEMNDRIRQFYQRCMQFTGPLMAKGVEDTLMYTCNRFIGHNEVGDSPEAFGESIEGFHQQMQSKQQRWPLSLNATATHDTKRGEDARARLNVLTDLHDEWLAAVAEWRNLNKELVKGDLPDANDEYLIYQALTANYPLPGEDEDDFANRFQAYIRKAVREAKIHSNWTSPNEAYETAATSFALALLDKSKPFWKSFSAFLETIAEHGVINSLSQVLLKFTCPGVPDVYQGCELWDYSFVDPDNRRPVDYERRLQLLQAFEEKSEEELFDHLWENRFNGSAKLWLVRTMLQMRKGNPDAFAEGEYIPLQVEGHYRNHVLAFARRHKRSVHVVAIPLHTAIISKEQGRPFFEVDWKDTKINLPREIESNLEAQFNKATVEKGKGLLPGELFNRFPVAILRGRQAINERGAGILLHLTSLPSPFGVGDMGPEARAFADFLYRSKQKYWQLLPLNPTEEGQGHSPYSALSSKAGYPLLLSPERMVNDGLLQPEDLQRHHLPRESRANFREAERVKNALFDKAFAAFVQAKESPLQDSFRQFQKSEKDWLDDFALFILLKKQAGGKPWYEWPDAYKKRNEEALKKLADGHRREIRKIKWLQFMFSRQWHELRDYCNSRNIKLIGDIPFYISYDSADVWANKEIFALDEEGKRTGMAGVPPDSFSADGQLWGMPVFRWDVLKETGYHWWVERLKKNRELFDMVRLDHFRAFAAYWEVAEGEQTAKNGQWIEGPGSDFFHAMEKELGQLPFVAEDLGDIDEQVLKLRDEFRLPGMKVLQFAFGEDMPQSDYIPHNYDKDFLVYTGTHDNNTTVGWYKTEANEDIRRRIHHYTATEVNERTIHQVFARLAYGSVAAIAILPIQDVLGLDESARMNVPSSAENNWAWRLTPGQISPNTEQQLLEWTRTYNRE